MNFWNNTNLAGSVRTELQIFGSEQTCDYLYDLITEITEPSDSYEEPNGMVVIFQKENAEKIFN